MNDFLKMEPREAVYEGKIPTITINETINNIGEQQAEIKSLVSEIGIKLIGAAVISDKNDNLSPKNVDCDSLLKYIAGGNMIILDELHRICGRL